MDAAAIVTFLRSGAAGAPMDALVSRISAQYGDQMVTELRAHPYDEALARRAEYTLERSAASDSRFAADLTELSKGLDVVDRRPVSPTYSTTRAVSSPRRTVAVDYEPNSGVSARVSQAMDDYHDPETPRWTIVCQVVGLVLFGLGACGSDIAAGVRPTLAVTGILVSWVGTFGQIRAHTSPSERRHWLRAYLRRQVVGIAFSAGLAFVLFGIGIVVIALASSSANSVLIGVGVILLGCVLTVIVWRRPRSERHL